METRGKRPWNGPFHLLGRRWAQAEEGAVAARVSGGAALLGMLAGRGAGAGASAERRAQGFDDARSAAALASLNRLAGLPRPHTEWRWFALARLLEREGGREELWQLERLAASMALRGCTKYERVRRLARALEACGEECAAPLHWGGTRGARGAAGAAGGEAPAGAAVDALALTAGERAATLEALDRGVYDVAHGGSALCRAVLLRAEDFWAAREGSLPGGAPPGPGPGPGLGGGGRGLTVEHVLPKLVERGSPWETAFSPAERAALTHRLGNLALVPGAQNREAARLGFRYKKKLFLGAGAPGAAGPGALRLTAGLGEFREWDARAVRARQADILELLGWGWDLRG